MLKIYIKKIADRQDLSLEEAQKAMEIIMTGQASEAQIAGFISIMRMKGETVDEITGFANVMKENAIKINAPKNIPVIDTCGTGGDNSGTFNISTVTAFVASGAGVVVAKHGNRAVSSSCGSADVLRELGVDIDVSPDCIEKSLNEVGMAFLFAPKLHPAMKYAAGPRKELGIRTFFNILGPLTNPADVKHQMIGVFSKDLLNMVANVLKKMGSKRSMVVSSADGLDEISLCDKTFVAELFDNGKIKEYTIKPENFGFKRVSLDELAGGEIEDNMKIVLNILKGEKGPKRDVVLLNAGAAIYISGMCDSIKKGVELARESIDSGKALEKLEKLRKFTV
ncbi:anthranilate phosphoribosyltransferase [bacterium]|nr:anthranilate phosphoribosyltransferase [bacterium]